MVHQIWRLSERGKDNLGPAVTADGLVLGRTPLIERRGDNFAVRDRNEIKRLLSHAYRTNVVVDQLMSGLATVAAALNANDQCLARIAAVHLRMPDLPNQNVRDDMEAEDVLIKGTHRNPPLHMSKIHKASPDDPKHPGWPAGTPAGRGGKFRPKDGSGTMLPLEVRNRIVRDALRIGLVAALHIGVEGLANLFPGVDIAADVAMAADIARTSAEFTRLAVDATAAFDFVKDGPRNLEDLQVSSNDYEEFSTYDQFYKGELRRDSMTKRFGSAGAGNQYHHVVTQGGANADKLPPEQLQNTENIIILPTLLHEAVTDEYLGPSPDNSNMTLYDWLQTQPYDVQRRIGLDILRDLHILKEH
jgi:hypothetical protein